MQPYDEEGGGFKSEKINPNIGINIVLNIQAHDLSFVLAVVRALSIYLCFCFSVFEKIIQRSQPTRHTIAHRTRSCTHARTHTLSHARAHALTHSCARAHVRRTTDRSTDGRTDGRTTAADPSFFLCCCLFFCSGPTPWLWRAAVADKAAADKAVADKAGAHKADAAALL